MKKLFSGIIVVSMLLLTGAGPVADDSALNGSYRVENIPMPEGLLSETGAIGFLPDGRLIAGFHRGEIMTYNTATKEWKLFAEGLHDPLGVLAISNSEVLVMQRPELTRLKDTNGDGQADLYETVTDDFGISGNYHEFAFGPVKDKAGNIFISLNTASNGAGIRPEVRGKYDSLGRKGRMYSPVPYRGWIMKLTPQGKLEPFALGFRSPNGLGFDLEGNLFTPDNQGDWIGTSPLYHVQEGKFYGHAASLVWQPGNNRVPITIPVPELDKMRTKAAVLFPHGIMANSPTQPLCDDTQGKFGPYAGQLFIGEMNQDRIVRVMLERVGGELQGACIPFIDGNGLRKGNNRLVFAPDGSLWVGQNDHGWAGDEGIQRIVYTGKSPTDVYNMTLTPTGFELTFTQPIDAATAADVANYKMRHYYYEYHEAYGSDQFDLQADQVSNIIISPDKRKVAFTVPGLKSGGYVYELRLGNIKGASGSPLANNLICYTVNKLKS